MEKVPDWMRNMAGRLRNAVRTSSFAVYCIVLAAFIAEEFVKRIAFAPEFPVSPSALRLFIRTVLIWAIVLHLPCVVVRALPLPPSKLVRIPAAAVAVILFSVLATTLGSRLGEYQVSILAGLYLVIFAWNKNYRGILKAYLAVTSAILFIAAAGVPLGLTQDNTKYSDYGVKLSFGMIHPNTTAHMIFLILILVWYLAADTRTGRDSEKPDSRSARIRLPVSSGKYRIFTFVLFWGAAVPVTVLIKCRTAAALMILFPLLYCLAPGLLSRRTGKLLFAASPFLCFALTLLLAGQMELLHRLTYGNFLRNFSERFVQAGIALRNYGLPLFGYPMKIYSAKAVLNGEKVSLFVMDNAYVTYGIFYGLVWLISCLTWIALGNQKMLREKNYRLAAVSVVMVVFALMERRGLNPAYNFLLLYPLAFSDSLYIKESHDYDKKQ